MEQIFNVIPGPDKDTCCILLYGAIGPWEEVTAPNIVSDILSAERTYKKIDVRINSVGGDVFAGIAIFNALRQTKAEVTIYIDCIAASTASFIAACGRTVKMSKYAQLMLHRPSSWADGDAETMKQRAAELEKVEEMLCQIYSERTGKGIDEIRATYMDGTDHWLSADEAMELGFIDEIYDIPEEEEPISNAYTPQQRCEQYTARYLDSVKSSLNIEQKMLEKIKKLPSFSDCADETAVMERIIALNDKVKEYDALVVRNMALETALNDYKEKEKQAHEKAIDDEIEAAVLSGKIGDDKRTNFKAMLVADYANAHAILESLPVKKRVSAIITPIDSGSTKTVNDMVDEKVAEVNARLKK